MGRSLLASPPMWAHTLAARIVAHRLAVLLVVAALSVVAGFGAARVQFDSDIESWFIEGDPNLETYRGFLERFEADEITVLGVFGDELFSPEVLAALDRFTEAAPERIPHLYRIRSLTNVKVVQRRGPGHVAVERLMEYVPESAEEAAELKARALKDPLVRDNLVAADGRATAVVLELDAKHNNFEDKVAFTEGTRRLMAETLPPGLELHLGGSPPLDEAFYKYTERDFMVLGPASGLVALLLMFLLFRRFTGAVVPLAVVLLANLWLFGLMGLLGVKINLISVSLGVLVLAVGIADSVHVLSDYYRAVGAGMQRLEAVVHSTGELLVPCLFTSGTTAAGFLSLCTSDLAPVAEFGWLAAVGVAFAFLLSVTVIPAVLAWAPLPDRRFAARQREGRITALLHWLGSPTPRRARLTLAASLLLVAGGGVALTRLDTEANPMNYFLPGDPARVAMQKVDEALAGSTSFEFLVTTRPGGLKDPAVLQRLGEFSDRVAGLPGVGRVLSVLDSLRETRKALTDGEQTGLPTPQDHPHLAAQLYLFLEGDDDFRTNVQDDYSVTRVTARVRMSQAHLLTRETWRIRPWIDELGGDDLRIEPTGYVMLMSEMEDYLVDSQIRSLGMAFVVITALMFLLLRSVRLGAFSMIPNLTPILMGLGFMALAGIALDPGTVMIGGMAMGLVVDDTIHFLVRLRRNLDGHSLEEAMVLPTTHTGGPNGVTSLGLAPGGATLALGSFAPNVAFGLVSAVVIVLALLADLLMLPAALLVIRPRLGR